SSVSMRYSPHRFLPRRRSPSAPEERKQQKQSLRSRDARRCKDINPTREFGRGGGEIGIRSRLGIGWREIAFRVRVPAAPPQLSAGGWESYFTSRCSANGSATATLHRGP